MAAAHSDLQLTAIHHLIDKTPNPPAPSLRFKITLFPLNKLLHFDNSNHILRQA